MLKFDCIECQGISCLIVKHPDGLYTECLSCEDLQPLSEHIEIDMTVNHS